MDYVQKLYSHQAKYGAHSIIEDVLENMGTIAFTDLIKACFYSFVKPSNRTNYHQIRVQFHSSYLAARVIGRQGECVKLIQRITNALITSPKCGYKGSGGQTEVFFLIQSGSKFNTFHAFAYIVMVGMFFSQKFDELVTPEPGEICEKAEVLPNLVPVLCQKNARFIQKIREKFALRIVSPKPYCPPCFFYFIGKKARVIKALEMFEVFTQKIIHRIEQ